MSSQGFHPNLQPLQLAWQKDSANFTSHWLANSLQVAWWQVENIATIPMVRLWVDKILHLWLNYGCDLWNINWCKPFPSCPINSRSPNLSLSPSPNKSDPHPGFGGYSGLRVPNLKLQFPLLLGVWNNILPFTTTSDHCAIETLISVPPSSNRLFKVSHSPIS